MREFYREETREDMSMGKLLLLGSILTFAGVSDCLADCWTLQEVQTYKQACRFDQPGGRIGRNHQVRLTRENEANCEGGSWVREQDASYLRTFAPGWVRAANLLCPS